jgi:hypothetical protein
MQGWKVGAEVADVGSTVSSALEKEFNGRIQIYPVSIKPNSFSWSSKVALSKGLIR